MDFLSPAFAWGAFALAIPLIVHFIHRKRYRTLDFPAIRFILESHQRKQRSVRLSQLLLLLIRTLLIAALVMAFARPALKLPGSMVAGKARRALVLVIDDTASTAVRSSGPETGSKDSSFGRSIEAARGLVSSLAADDRVAVLTASSGASEPLFIAPGRAAETLAGLDSTPVGGNGLKAMRTAVEALGKREEPDRSIVIFTDLQAGFVPVDFEGGGIPVRVVNTRGNPGGPIPAITGVEVSSDMVAPGMTVTVRAFLSNCGFTPSEPRKVSLFTESGRVDARVGEIAASGTGEAVFTVSFSRPGLYGCRVEVEGNENPHGSRFFFPVEVRSRIFVLLVNGTQARLETASATYFADLALNPSGEEGGGLGMAPVVCQAHELARHDLNNYDAVILANVPGFDSVSAKALDGFVRSGGGLLVLCGEALDPEAAGRAYGNLIPGRPLKRVKAPPGGSGLFRLTAPKLDHPVLFPFRGDGSGALGLPGFTEAMAISVNELDPGVSILATLNDEIPAIVEGRLGMGRVIFFASTMDSTWDTLVTEPAFVPLLHQIVRRLAARGTASSGLIDCGASFDARLPLSAVKGVVNVVDPSGKRTGLKTEPTTSFLVARYSKTLEAGIYTVETDDGARAGKTLFAANPPASEWETARTGPAADSDPRFPVDTGEAASFSYEMWKFFLWAMVLLGLAELVMANRMAAPDQEPMAESHGRHSGGSSSPSVSGFVLPVLLAALGGQIFGAPAQGAEEILARTFEFGNPADVMTWVLVAVAFGIAVASYRRVRERAGIAKGPMLLALRLLGLAIVLAMLLKPVMVMDLQITLPGVTVVLVDTSDSMSIVDSPASGPAGPGRSRIEAVRTELGSTGFFDAIEDLGDLEVYSFSSNLEPARRIDFETTSSRSGPLADPIGGLLQRGGHTDMGGAMIGVRQAMKERRLTSMVLVGDGRNTFGQDPALMARLAGVPVHTLGVGSVEALKDAAIEGVMTRDTAFVDAPLKVEVKISAKGYDGARTAVTLLGDGRELARKFVTLGPAPARETLVFTPDSPGIFTLEINVPAQPGEVVLANNSRKIIVNVVESRVRTLLVGERPSWDYKFLKSTLEEDESVLLASLCLNGDGQPVGIGHGAMGEGASRAAGRSGQVIEEGSVNDSDSSPSGRGGAGVGRGKGPGPPKSWPVTDYSALAAFDVIILCDPAGLADSCTVLTRAVADGKGLLLAGDLSGVLAPKIPREGGIIQGLSPIIRDPRAMRPEFTGELTLALTEAGIDHPVTKLAPGRNANASSWSEWPTLPGAFVAKPKAGAVVLAEVSSRTTGQTPALCAQRYGKGRVLSFTAEGIWKLRFKMAGVGKGAGHFRRLVANSVRWLKPRPDDGFMTLDTDKRHYLLGERVHVSASLFDENFSPLPGASITLRLAERSGSGVERVYSAPGKDDVSLSDSGGGTYTGSFAPRATGEFDLLATASGAGPARTAATRILVMTPPEEFLEVARDQGMLERVSSISGGTCLDLTRASELVSKIEAPKTSYETRREIALWNTWHAFMAFLTVLTLEWVLRKREGLE